MLIIINIFGLAAFLPSMGGLYSAMAGVADETAPASAVACKDSSEEEESWENEVNMDVFYTDAAKYWEV